MQPEIDTTTGTLHIPANVEKLGTAFLHQQFWCWGYDIRHADGDRLVHMLPLFFLSSITSAKRFSSAYAVKNETFFTELHNVQQNRIDDIYIICMHYQIL
jgi:hypothetical protein